MKIAKEVFTLVCDDIREEVGGKASLMGVYNDIVFQGLPAVLPKLSFAIILRGLLKKFSKVDFVVKLPGENPVKLKTMSGFGQVLKIGESCNLHLAMAPFAVKTAGQVRLELIFDDAKEPQIVHTFEVKTGPVIHPHHQKDNPDNSPK